MSWLGGTTEIFWKQLELDIKRYQPLDNRSYFINRSRAVCQMRIVAAYFYTIRQNDLVNLAGSYDIYVDL